MAGPNDRHKPFRGKKPIKDLREFKSKEIKKSLVHRARLRKNYFKLLEQEGEVPPHRQNDEAKHDGSEKNGSEGNGSESSEDEEGKHIHTARRAGPLPPQRAPPPERRPQRKPTNFAERAKMAKQRKEDQRLERVQKVTERREAVDKLNRQRERKKITLARRTKTGQPLMGPRINNLLDKIKHDMN